ncbi:HDOD domain-containing protein [Allohahella sp. A8]|uniref:HDOD domain-containing protein n=1 Tax=Allohahella sp. A8 TaxID=3141461 RepID=UPI000C0AC5E9|nr:hypothetical protein [Hahellaceae bacterium]|tara:strand:+ start:68401 stop:69306 length:906 start_codon:yes stop_codon:yes gene_type:complete
MTVISDRTANSFVDTVERRVDKGDIDIPMLPDTALQVIRVTQDPDSDAQDLLKVVQTNQAIVGKIMSTANSAAYASASGITSIQQAIGRLGMNIIRDIALASSLNARLFDAPGLEGHVQNACEHALMTALWSRRIAQHLHGDADTAFLCGLLHSVGLPIMMQEVVDVAESTGMQDLTEQLEFVIDIAYELTPQATALALKSWKLPATINAIIGNYLGSRDTDNSLQLATEAAGQVDEAEQQQSRFLAAAVDLASHGMVDFLDAAELVKLESIQALGLSQQGLEQLIAAGDTVKSQFDAFSL